MDSVVIKNQAALGKLSPLPQPLMTLKTADDEESIQDKAHRMWHVLRGAVNDSTEKIRRSDWKPLDLENGIQHVQRVIFKKAIHNVLFNVNTKEYICMVSKTGVCIYHCDGRKKQEFTLREPLEGLVYAQQINRYVAWNTCPQLKVLDSDFQTISTNRSKQTITCCLYNEDLSEIVTAGIGNICSWHFYFGCRDLMCASTITKGLTEHDVFTELALERAPVLASTLPRTQRCYAVCGMGVAVFDLPKATLISYEKDLHNRKITGIAVFETLRCVVTSSRDGNIKIWDENWNLQMVFVGHRGPVTALAIYPHGPYLLSASEDKTIRTWSLVMGDQVNEIQMGVAVTRLGTEFGEDSIFSYANQRLDLWTIVHLYNQHTTIGYTVRAIKAGNVGMVSHFPMRAVCSCADGAARLVSSDTGDVIATFLLERGQQVVDLDYCLVREALLVLSDEGDIVKANALTNPMETMWKVPGSSQASQLCCFCIFTHVANMELTHSRWLQAVAGGSERKIKIVGVKDHDRFLLIAGHLNGFLSVLDWNSGITQYQVQAHESRVLTLVADPENQHLLSSGEDNTIKVWRVFPYAQESLSLLMNFYSAHCSTHLCVLKTMFVVALQNPMCAVHTIVLCDLWKKIRRDHHPANDHEDEIIGLCACPELKIFASTSRGGILKIWDHNNQLLRIIHLKAVVDSISFCNDVGDLLLGIERNLYHMNSKEYLTQPYLLRIACRDASDRVPDVPVPISSTALDSLSAEDRQRLRGPHSFKHSPKHPVVEPDEPDEDSMKKQEQLREAYALLAVRDEEIRLIQRGELKSKAKPPRTKEICEEGFRKYMQLFYVETPKIEICEDELDDPGEKLIKPKSLFEGPYKCIPISRGFFPPLALPKPWELVSDKEKMARGLPSWVRTPFIPIALDGFIPNSVFLRLLWPLEPWEILESESMSQAESELELKVEMKTESKEELRLSKEMQPLYTSTKRSSIFLEKLEAVMEEERRKMEEQAESNVDVPVPVPVEEKERKFSTAAMRNSLIIRRRSTLVKDVPTPPTVPSVVALFRGYAWFEKLFPNADASNFPPDLSEKAFAEMLIMLLATADYDVKEGIAKALVVLLASQRSNITRLACDALIAAINGPNPPRQELFLSNKSS
ncbi:WD repeat-containing protein 97 isoform X2 [Heterodontus francisci]|uniref:WD repeat-containing protein 97 isoform X2 n=1 Tax=Heterodontus francisci TaxID=7792 RepID=UPI00355B8FE0